jgi:plastocyanin
MSSRRAVLTLVAVSLAPTLAWSAPAAVASVSLAPATAQLAVGPGGSATFVPSAVKIRIGGTVTWTWASSGHSVTDSSGLGLFDSGVLSAGSTFSHTFTASGKYRYASTSDEGMTGTVNIPIRINPDTGSSQTIFKITWATVPPPHGLSYHVKCRYGALPWGTCNFGPLMSVRSQLRAGKWEFRARLEDSGTGRFVDWSPFLIVEVRSQPQRNLG